MNEPSTEITDEQHWQAFRYAQDEMSVNERESFEEQMLLDANLCAATADACLLRSAVLSADDVPSVKSHPTPAAARSGQRLAAVATAVCTCAGLLLTLQFTRPSTDSTASAADNDAELLVGMWAAEFADDEEPLDDVDDNTDVGLDVPDWMFAGVETESADRRPAHDSDAQELL